MDAKLQELKDKYSLFWKDWYYWPLEDDEGQAQAKKRLDEVGAELNAYKNKTHNNRFNLTTKEEKEYGF